MRENPDTISLGQGVVHYGPPRIALEAAHNAIELPASHMYGYVIGHAELRQAFAAKMLRENNLDPGFEVVVTAGSNMAFFESVLAITDPSDEVILIGPYYFNHEMAVRIASCTPVIVPCGPHSGTGTGRAGPCHHTKDAGHCHDLPEQSHGRRLFACTPA